MIFFHVLLIFIKIQPELLSEQVLINNWIDLFEMREKDS